MADTPKHSVSVAGIVVNDAGQVLVIQRRDNGHWEAPGGFSNSMNPLRTESAARYSKKPDYTLPWVDSSGYIRICGLVSSRSYSVAHLPCHVGARNLRVPKQSPSDGLSAVRCRT